MSVKDYWDILQDVWETLPEQLQFILTLVIIIILAPLIAIIIANLYKKNIKELLGGGKKGGKENATTPTQQSSPEPQVVTIQVSSQPPAENPASSSDTTVKQLTLPPVYIVKPLYRENLVDELCRKISVAAQAEEDNKFLLHGFGGVGKTTVARALYHKLKKQCKQIGWVECRESGSLRGSLLAAIDTGSGNKTDEERFAEIERLLRDATGEAVLFLDNVDRNDPLLRELTRYDLTLVVTSRMEQVEGYTSIFIPQLTEDECEELFRVYCARTLTEEDEPVVRKLVELVSCHTLSVELLAKGIPPGKSLPEYLEQLEAEGFGFPGLTFRTGHDEEVANIAGHLRKLFNMAGLGPEQARVMQNLALMADSRTLPFEVRDWIGCEETTLAALVNTGWLTQTEEGYEVHPIVRQVVLLDEVPLSEVEHYLNYVTCKAYFQDGEDYRTVQFKLGIVESVLERVEDRLEESEDNAALHNNLGNVYEDQGQYAQAEKCHRKALGIRRKVLGEEHPDTASSYNNLGVVYRSQGKYNQAEKYYKNALDIYRKVLGENHLDTAGSYNNLGTVYSVQGQYDEAEKYYKNALDIYRKVLGENHPDTAMSYNNLGVVYRNQGNYIQAEKRHRKALDIYRKVLGEEAPDTAMSYDNLGNVYADQGEYAEAEKCHRKALNIRRKVLGEEHPDTARSYNNLGTVYYSQGEYAQAEECHLKALDIRRKTLGENHPDTATSYNNLGVDYKHQERYGEAVEQYLHAWRIWERVLGPEHPYTEKVKNNLRRVFPYIAHGDEDFETWLSRQQED